MDVTVSEVGPRDGLQSIKRTLPTEAKHRWIAALAQAGLREIEVGSFVSPKVLPQMADCAEVVAQARTHPGPARGRAGAEPALRARWRSRPAPMSSPFRSR